MGVNSIRK